MRSASAELAGNLLVGGFDGTTLPGPLAHDLSRGHRAGVILFSRNIESPRGALQLNRQIIDATRGSTPLSPIVSVDQEGGRVRRLKAPVLALPPMRALGDASAAGAPTQLAERAGRELGRQLATLGFNVDFAPVLDVDSNPQNPVIGDRSFSRDPNAVGALGAAFARGLQTSGVAACGKHFPGHGDTDVDSHVGLPIIRHDLERLRRVEWVPFAHAIDDGIASLMTAHIVCTELDRARPATLSKTISTDYLRGELGFDGVLISDDLEMQAVSNDYGAADAALLAIEAGCDLLLVCRQAEAQTAVFEALVSNIDARPDFRKRCEEAAHRVQQMRRRFPARAAAHYDETWLRSAEGGELEALFSSAAAPVGGNVGEP